MRRGSILTRYQKPRFPKRGAATIPAYGGPQPQPTHPATRIPAYTYGRAYSAIPQFQALGTNGERRAGILLPVTFPTLVTGAIVLGIGMTLWHVVDTASKTYHRPRIF